MYCTQRFLQLKVKVPLTVTSWRMQNLSSIFDSSAHTTQFHKETPGNKSWHGISGLTFFFCCQTQMFLLTAKICKFDAVSRREEFIATLLIPRMKIQQLKSLHGINSTTSLIIIMFFCVFMLLFCWFCSMQQCVYGTLQFSSRADAS